MQKIHDTAQKSTQHYRSPRLLVCYRTRVEGFAYEQLATPPHVLLQIVPVGVVHIAIIVGISTECVNGVSPIITNDSSAIKNDKIATSICVTTREPWVRR